MKPRRNYWVFVEMAVPVVAEIIKIYVSSDWRECIDWISSIFLAWVKMKSYMI